jgi:hypothetical protein
MDVRKLLLWVVIEGAVSGEEIAQVARPAFLSETA